ncbi:MAG: hypothetical protein CBB71_01125 [Rhodopirellula sp. TMED11]|nr:MAG: hypothetical protein CBB71_01125 [Rhodopirellula sp. TMED11]
MNSNPSKSFGHTMQPFGVSCFCPANVWPVLGFVYGALMCSLPGCEATPTDSSDVPGVAATSPATAVHAEPAIREEVVSESILVGTVSAIRRSVVGSPVDGRVIAVNVESGDLVAANEAEDGVSPAEPIVELSAETIDAEIAAATAELQRLEYELEELRSGSRPEEVARAKANWEASQAILELADARLMRSESLKNRNAASGDEYESAESVAEAARQKLVAAKADHDLIIAGPRREQIAQSVAKVEKQKQEVAHLNILRSYHTIEAPFAGHVVQKHTEVGQWVNRGDPVAEVVSLDPIDVVVHVPESLVNELRAGDIVPLWIAALPNGERTLEGKIQGIGPSADQRARTFPVRIRLQNPQHDGVYLLRDGMQARATVYGAKRSAITVSKDALVLGGPTPVVMVVSESEGGKTVATKVEVAIGIAHESSVEVLGDIQEGQHVIIEGNERLQSGTEVRLLN